MVSFVWPRIKYFIEGGINYYHKEYKCLQSQCYQHSIITLVYSSMGVYQEMEIEDGSEDHALNTWQHWSVNNQCCDCGQVQFRCNRRHLYRSSCCETVTRWSIVNIVSDRHPSFESQCQDTWHRCGVDDLWPPDKVMMTVPIGGCTAFNLPP